MRDWNQEQRQAHVDNHQAYGGTYECPTDPDFIRELLEEPPRQKMYSAKHCLNTNPDDAKKNREILQEAFNETWKKFDPNAEVPVLHDPLTPEDMWNLRRAMMFAMCYKDIGPYPGDEKCIVDELLQRVYSKQVPTDPNAKYVQPKLLQEALDILMEQKKAKESDE